MTKITEIKQAGFYKLTPISEAFPPKSEIITVEKEIQDKILLKQRLIEAI